MRGYKRPGRRRFRGSLVSAARRLPEWLALAAACAAFVLALCVLARSAITSLHNRQYAEWHEQAESASAAASPVVLQRMGMPDGSPISAEKAWRIAGQGKDIVASTSYHRVSGAMLPEMDALSRKNMDLKAWLTIDGMLDLPVVYKDNQFYLDHDFDRNRNAAGTLFLDEFHPLRKTTQHLLIHGHNMKDGSMFGLLTHYRLPLYWQKHPFISLSTLWEKEEYVVFAVLDVPLDPKKNEYINYFTHPSFASDAEFEAYISGLRKRSLISSYLNVEPGDALLSLSTCVGENRLVVTARRIRPTETRQELLSRIR